MKSSLLYYHSNKRTGPLLLILAHVIVCGCFLFRPCGSFLLQSSTPPRSTAVSFATPQTTITTSWTRDELMDYANQQGITLTLTTLGPAYRCVARSQHNTTQVLGYVEGILRPQPLLHLDKMEVFRPMLQRARDENPAFTGGGNSLGIGLIMGYLCLLHGQENGCTKAEFLAIDDEDKQHKRLVRYYRHAGFQMIKYVGDAVWDIRIDWSGEDVGLYWERILKNCCNSGRD